MKSQILLLVEDRALSTASARELRKLRATISHCQNNVMEQVFDAPPHLIVIDENFKQGSGLQIANAFKEDVVLRYIPIILLAEHSFLLGSRESENIDCLVHKKKLLKSLLSQARAILGRNHNELDLNPLTSLPGARSSILRIERAIRSKAPFAVCCIDLTNLAALNNAYGDVRGDEIIIRLGHIIQDAIKYHGSPDDFLGHLGGDDLILVTSSESAEALSEMIIQNFDSTILNFYNAKDREQGYLVQLNKDGMPIQYPIMNVSIAIVQNDHKPRYRMPQISKIAGELKKYMKALPGSCYIRYRREPGTKNNAPGSLEVRFPSKMKSIAIVEASKDSDRQTAFFKALLKSKSICTLYQPILDLQSKKIVGYEALSRALSDMATQDASLLFNAAREAGLVKELDRLCVECALKNGQALGADQKIFLNLNQESLLDPKLMRSLFVDKGALGFKNLVIEVTEQSILRSFDKVRNALLELKEQGVSVAIDDVGGGAVSLRDVAVVKPDYIKFDRSLIRQMDVSTTKQQIVLSMILFAKGIRAQTTAEGIETREEYETALMCGVNLGQGYYFARPGPAFPKLSI